MKKIIEKILEIMNDDKDDQKRFLSILTNGLQIYGVQLFGFNYE